MKILVGPELPEAKSYIELARKIAIGSTCLRSRCGSVIVKNRIILGAGYNSPPGNLRPTKCMKDQLPNNFKSDRTCCIHAEQRAIIDALKHNSDQLPGSRLYFVRLDSEGQIRPSGAPYCTICSKLALEVGISEFVLIHNNGITVYPTKEYNELSFLNGRYKHCG